MQFFSDKFLLRNLNNISTEGAFFGSNKNEPNLAKPVCVVCGEPTGSSLEDSEVICAKCDEGDETIYGD